MSELSRTGTDIGGSDAPAILGEDPRRDGFSVWLASRGQSETEETWRMALGKIFERPAIEELYPRITGRVARHNRERIRSRRPGYEWMYVTPDGFAVEDERGIEMKLVAWDQRHAWSEEAPPSWVEVQARFCMAALELPRYDVLAVFGMDTPAVYTLERDLEVEDAMLDLIGAFRARYIVGGEQPPMGGSEAAAEWLKRTFPRHQTKLRRANDREVALLEQYAQARSYEREAVEERKSIENELKLAVADAEGIEWENGRFTWKNVKDSARTDWEALARGLMREYPEETKLRLIEEFTSVVPGYRRIFFACRGEDS